MVAKKEDTGENSWVSSPKFVHRQVARMVGAFFPAIDVIWCERDELNDINSNYNNYTNYTNRGWFLPHIDSIF